MQQLMRRSLLYLVTGAVTIGTTSMVAPVHFGRHFPEQKAVLLALCLVIGSVAAVLGIRVSGARVTRTPHTRSLLGRRGALSLFALLGLLCTSLYLTVDAFLFVAAFAGVHFVNQFVFNTVDQQYVRNTAPAGLGAHAQLAAAYSLAGMVLSPVTLALAGSSPATGPVAGATVFLALAWAVRSQQLSAVPGAAATAVPAGGAPAGEAPAVGGAGQAAGGSIDRQDRAFGLFYLLAYGAVMSVSSQMVFIVSDHYRLDAAVVSAGMLLGVSQVAALVAVVLLALARRKSGREVIAGVRVPAAAAGAFTLAALLVLGRLVPSLAYLVAVAVLTGMSFGAVQLWIRSYASRRAQRRPAVLSMFNNVANYASLFAFALNLCLALAAAALGLSAVALVLGGVLACAAGALAVVGWTAPRYVPADSLSLPTADAPAGAVA